MDLTKYIGIYQNAKEPIELLDLDHDFGDYAFDGGDGINYLITLLKPNNTILLNYTQWIQLEK